MSAISGFQSPAAAALKSAVSAQPAPAPAPSPAPATSGGGQIQRGSDTVELSSAATESLESPTSIDS